jgi:hypothetical protein
MDRLDFTWDRVEGAGAYLFTLSLGAGNGASRQILSAGPLGENSLGVDLRRLDRGAFEWKVEALGIAGDGAVIRHGVPAEGRFSIDLPPEGEIEIYEPGVLYGFQEN